MPLVVLLCYLHTGNQQIKTINSRILTKDFVSISWDQSYTYHNKNEIIRNVVNNDVQEIDYFTWHSLGVCEEKHEYEVTVKYTCS